MEKNKIVRTSTIPLSLNILLKGQLEYLSQYFEVIGISSNGPELKETENREGIKTVPINMKRSISPLKDLISLITLYKVLKREKPLIIHSITPKAGLLSMMAAKLAGVPIRMHTFTGLIFPSKKGLLQKLLIKMDQLLCVCATHIYPEGEGVKADLIKYKITKKPLKVIANGNVNGIDRSHFDPTLYSTNDKKGLRQSLDISENDFVYIFVGRLVTDKGINELVEAFSEISKKHDQAKLLLVGPFEKELDPLKDATLKEINKNQNIITVGFKSDVRPYFAISDVLVFPSYREGFPNVVMQAGAMALPSIVSNINGCNEIIIEGENGTIIPAKDKKTLTEKMELFISDKILLENLSSKARGLIISRYEQQIVWNALLEEYQSLEKQYKGNV